MHPETGARAFPQCENPACCGPVLGRTKKRSPLSRDGALGPWRSRDSIPDLAGPIIGQGMSRKALCLAHQRSPAIEGMGYLLASPARPRRRAQ